MKTLDNLQSVTYILMLAGLAIAVELAVPLFEIDGPSAWRYTDGAVVYQVKTSYPEAANVTANCSVVVNGLTATYDWSHNLTFSQLFQLTGMYNATVTCSNSVNKVTAFHIINIVSGDVPIRGLLATVPGYVLIDTPAEIKVSAEEGTDILYRVTPGGDDSRWILTSGIDTSTSVIHTFTKFGKITLVITATNEVSFAQTRPKSDVIRPVKGFRLTASHEIASFTETITYYLILPGNDNFPMGPLRLEFIDNGASISEKTSLTLQPSKTVEVLSRNFSLGVHLITARVSSPLSAEDISSKLTVIEPLTEFNASNLMFHASSIFPLNSTAEVSNITIRMEIPDVDTSQPPPLGIQVTWDFDDGTIETEFITSWIKEHSYNERGNYTVTTLTKLTGVMDTHSTRFQVRIGVLNVTLTPNTGIAGDTVFTYFLSGAEGCKVQFKVDFGNGQLTSFNKTNVTESEVIQVNKLYHDSGTYQPTVIVWDDHFVEEIILNEYVSVYVPLMPFTVIWDDRIVPKLPVSISFSLNFIGQLPTNASCALDFGDGETGVMEINTPEMTTQFTHTYSTELETTSLEMVTDNAISTSAEATSTEPETSTTTESLSNFTFKPYMTASAVELEMETGPTDRTTTVSIQMTTSIVINHNYTQLGSFSLEIVCSNNVSNFTNQWTVLLKSAASRSHYGFRNAYLVLVLLLCLFV